MRANKKTPSWLPELMDQVNAGLRKSGEGKQERRPALEAELQELTEKIQGWNVSLARPTLPDAVREAIELQWGEAEERRQELKAQLAELTQADLQAEELVEPDQVVRKLERLADVLAETDPTRGNLELSLHIHRIRCFHGGRVELRMCKLGVMPDAVELLAHDAGAIGTSSSTSTETARRRRGKLRVIEDEGDVDLQTQAEFAADSDRFAGLGDQWFWIDEFRIPESRSWAAENAEAVFQRRVTEQLSFAELAAEFDVTPPTIGAAVKKYLQDHPNEADIRLAKGGKRKPKIDLAPFADEARRLWLAGESKEKLAERFGCSEPTVTKAITFAYEREGGTMPTRTDMLRENAAAARRLHDAGSSLAEIAAAMRISTTTARAYLRSSLAAEGKSLPDLRRRPKSSDES